MGIVKKSKSWERSCLLMGLTNFWGTRNNFGVIFFLCLHGFCFVYISRPCHLLWPEGLH